MRTTRHPWIERLATGAAIVALPLAVLAHGPFDDNAPAAGCMAAPHAGTGPMGLPPHGMFPDAPPAPLPVPPFLHGIDLTETQQDKLFALMHEQAPVEREHMKSASKAMEELHRIAASERFDAEKARNLAAAQAQAMAQVALMHAELESKVRALLTPEQRKQLDEAHAKAESHRSLKRS
jgi:Spy/CpxP family protein refolding chaperone